jgi:hypothetical protein
LSRYTRERLFGILIIDAEAAFDRDRNGYGGLHGRHTIADEIRLGHQAGAEAPFLDAVRRAADIQIDLVETGIGADARALRQRLRRRAAKLQRHRVLGRIEAEKPRAIAMQHRPGGEHFGIEKRAARQQPVEEPAVTVGPFHHRSDTETMGPTF